MKYDVSTDETVELITGKEDAKIDIPVLLIFFNRPQKIAAVFEQVKKARPARVYLYQDGARENREDDIESVKACRAAVSDIDWNCEVHRLYQSRNYGCDPSEFIAQKWMFSYEEMGIILEDDDVPAQALFPFFRELLIKYKDDNRVAIICGMNNYDIEKEVKETIGTVAAALQDAAREVSTSLRDNESVQRTVKDLGAAARDGVQGIQSAIAQAQKNAEKEKRRRKRRDYAKKANGALSEAGGLMLPAGILAACAFSAFEPGDPAGALILGFISLWFFAGAFGAFLKSRTLRRIATYQSVLGERSYCTLQELSELTGKSQGAVRKDLFRLISSGKYEDVYLAPDGTRLFSGETAYRLYLAQRQAQQEAGARRQAQPARPEPAGVLAECRAFLSDLREQQRLISDAPVLEQVQRIEEQTVQIIAWLEKHPGGESQIRRFVSYYMPTTLKLLRTYNEVDPQADSSAVAAEIQTDICGILYTINTAFQSLQDNLLKDTAMDVSAEISALETVLAQEGLTKDELLGR